MGVGVIRVTIVSSVALKELVRPLQTSTNASVVVPDRFASASPRSLPVSNFLSKRLLRRLIRGQQGFGLALNLVRRLVCN